jgi:zinc/manganese transport system substrate-binding protein
MFQRSVCLKIISAILLLPLLSGIGACQGKAVDGQVKKSIVVTYSILGSIVKDLIGDQAEVKVLIPNGLDPHEWEPSAKDIEAVYKADLVVRNGLGLEAGLEKTLTAAEKKGIKTFSAADHIQIRYVSQGEGIPSDDPDQAIGAADPHLWMDPIRIEAVEKSLAKEIQTIFGWDLSRRATDLGLRLENLDQMIKKKVELIPASQRKLVTGHESMGYFAERYGFKLVGVIVPSLSSRAEVTAANLAELKKAVDTSSVKAIFTELGTSAATAKTIAEETGVKVVELGTHTLTDDGSYITYISNLADEIIEALK